MSALTTNHPGLTSGRAFSTDDFWFIANAQPGTTWSTLNVRNPAHDPPEALALNGIIVVETGGRRLAVGTDGHRLHAVPVSGQPPLGLYMPKGGEYERTTDDDLSMQVHRQIREILDDLQLPATPHPMGIVIAQRLREDLLEAIATHQGCALVVAFRRASITLHDADSDELVQVLASPAKGMQDRTRTETVVVFKGSVLYEAVRSRILRFTAPKPMGPYIGHHRSRMAVLMPMRPPVGIATMWDHYGAPIGQEAAS